LKVSANVKIAMQCLEIFGGGKCPKCHTWLRSQTLYEVPMSNSFGALFTQAPKVLAIANLL